MMKKSFLLTIVVLSGLAVSFLDHTVGSQIDLLTKKFMLDYGYDNFWKMVINTGYFVVFCAVLHRFYQYDRMLNFLEKAINAKTSESLSKEEKNKIYLSVLERWDMSQDSYKASSGSVFLNSFLLTVMLAPSFSFVVKSVSGGILVFLVLIMVGVLLKNKLKNLEKLSYRLRTIFLDSPELRLAGIDLRNAINKNNLVVRLADKIDPDDGALKSIVVSVLISIGLILSVLALMI